jgi:hypothetical protein
VDFETNNIVAAADTYLRSSYADAVLNMPAGWKQIRRFHTTGEKQHLEQQTFNT